MDEVGGFGVVEGGVGFGWWGFNLLGTIYCDFFVYFSNLGFSVGIGTVFVRLVLVLFLWIQFMVSIGTVFVRL